MIAMATHALVVSVKPKWPKVSIRSPTRMMSARVTCPLQPVVGRGAGDAAERAHRREQAEPDGTETQALVA